MNKGKEQARICYNCDSCGWCDNNPQVSAEIMRIIKKYDDATEQEHKSAMLNALKRV